MTPAIFVLVLSYFTALKATEGNLGLNIPQNPYDDLVKQLRNRRLDWDSFEANLSRCSGPPPAEALKNLTNSVLEKLGVIGLHRLYSHAVEHGYFNDWKNQLTEIIAKNEGVRSVPVVLWAFETVQISLNNEQWLEILPVFKVPGMPCLLPFGSFPKEGATGFMAILPREYETLDNITKDLNHPEEVISWLQEQIGRTERDNATDHHLLRYFEIVFVKAIKEERDEIYKSVAELLVTFVRDYPPEDRYSPAQKFMATSWVYYLSNCYQIISWIDKNGDSDRPAEISIPVACNFSIALARAFQHCSLGTSKRRYAMTIPQVWLYDLSDGSVYIRDFFGNISIDVDETHDLLKRSLKAVKVQVYEDVEIGTYKSEKDKDLLKRVFCNANQIEILTPKIKHAEEETEILPALPQGTVPDSQGVSIQSNTSELTGETEAGLDYKEMIVMLFFALVGMYFIFGW